MRVAVGNFVRRQTPESRFSHFTGTWNHLVELVELNWHHQLPGYRDGVIRVPVPTEGFFSAAIPAFKDTPLKSRCEARDEKEEPVIVTVAKGEKGHAGSVEIILYHHDVLEDTGQVEVPDAEWEIVSINATPMGYFEEVPMSPVTMARNFLGKTGGTKGVYTAEEFARSIWFWATHAAVES